jgi:hypothetical protein
MDWSSLTPEPDVILIEDNNQINNNISDYSGSKNGQSVFDYQDSLFIIKETHFTCVQCRLLFNKASDYMLHLKDEHCIQVFQCTLCNKQFNSLYILKEHFLREHHLRKFDLFKCRICLKRNLNQNYDPFLNGSYKGFNHIDDLYHHLYTSHNIRVDNNNKHKGFNDDDNCSSFLLI